MAVRSVLVAAWVFATALGMIAVAGCASDGQPELGGTSWKLSGWEESFAWPADVTITATFADSVVSGTSGVNTYSGGYESDSSGFFSAGPLAGTMMAGPEDAMKAEAAFVKRLDSAESYSITAGKLVLRDADGNESLAFTATD